MKHSKQDLFDEAVSSAAGMLTGITLWINDHPVLKSVLIAMLIAATSTLTSWLMKKITNMLDRMFSGKVEPTKQEKK